MKIENIRHFLINFKNFHGNQLRRFRVVACVHTDKTDRAILICGSQGYQRAKDETYKKQGVFVWTARKSTTTGGCGRF